MGADLWFGLGTGAQVMPPLDNAQLTDKAFLAEGRFGFGKHLSKVFDLGVVVPVSTATSSRAATARRSTTSTRTTRRPGAGAADAAGKHPPVLIQLGERTPDVYSQTALWLASTTCCDFTPAIAGLISVIMASGASTLSTLASGLPSAVR